MVNVSTHLLNTPFNIYVFLYMQILYQWKKIEVEKVNDINKTNICFNTKDWLKGLVAIRQALSHWAIITVQMMWNFKAAA